MNVRVCGPNLMGHKHDETFHVHEASCNDLRNYGPDRILGGEMYGIEEMVIEDATVMKVVTEVYADQISEQPEQERQQYINSLPSDFWFAPCCDGIQHDLPSTGVVYECWVSGQSDTGVTGGFTKRSDHADVALWVAGILPRMDKHAHVHIVKHDASDYRPPTG